MLDDAINFASITLRNMLYAEKQGDRDLQMTAAVQAARGQHICPVVHVMESYLQTDVTEAVMPSPETPPGIELARMLALADYAQRDFAVQLFEALEFNDFAAELARQPEIVHRDGLPPAQQFLTDLLNRVEVRCGSEGYSERYRTRFYVAQLLLKKLRGTFSELDGYVPKIPVIMTRFLAVFDVAKEKVDKDAVLKKLRSTV